MNIEEATPAQLAREMYFKLSESDARARLRRSSAQRRVDELENLAEPSTADRIALVDAQAALETATEDVAAATRRLENATALLQEW